MLSHTYSKSGAFPMREVTAVNAKRRAWKAFSAYIRQRDPYCITCSGRTTEAGHFLHTSDKDSNPHLGGNELWYNEKNVNGQEGNCNRHRSGNGALYAVKLVEMYGDGVIQELHKLYRTKKVWTVEELLAVEKKYKALVYDTTEQREDIT